MFLFAALEAEDHKAHVRLRNVSQGGALIETVIPPPRPGCRITLRRHAMRVEGEVAWVEGKRVGIRFDEPLPPDHRFRSLDETMAWFVPAKGKGAAFSA